jgi:hypothetical protein
MTLRAMVGTAAVLLLAALPARAADYSIKIQDKAAAPKEVQEPIRKLLADRAIQLLDAKGEMLAEVWLCKEVPGKATEAQIKNGLTYRELSESAVLGAIRLHKDTTDYRKQKVKAGVYTLRLGYQPEDGDHMGTAPYAEFALMCPAADDKSADTMEAKALFELSALTTKGHPSVWLLYPGKDAGEPKLLDKGEGTWVLMYKQPVAVGATKTSIGIGLTLVGVSSKA